MIPVCIPSKNKFKYNKKEYSIYDKTNLSGLKFHNSKLKKRKLKYNLTSQNTVNAF
jgi:hypothetical protein